MSSLALNSSFNVSLQSPFSSRVIAGVRSVATVDATGSFGILARHERMMTILEFGFTTVGTIDDGTLYVAHPGGVIYFSANTLYLVTNRFLISDNQQGNL